MRQNIKNSARTNGLIIGALLSIKFLISTQNNTLLSMIALLVSVTIIIVIYQFAVKFRNNVCEGSIGFGQAFSYVFQVYMYGALISSLIALIYCQFIDKTFLENLLNTTLTAYKNLSIPMNEDSLKMITLIFKPAPYALMNLFASALNGAFWGLILGAVVKKDKNIFDNEQ